MQKYLEPDQFRLYQLIWQRFVASQMTPAVYDMTIVDFDLGQYLFRATGSVLIFDGYHVLYTEGREAEEGKTMDDLPPIPPLAGGRPVEVREITPSQHFTEPPPRFSEASLVKELERLGIGRPSHLRADHPHADRARVREAGAAAVLPHRAGRDGREDHGRASSPTIFNVEFTSEMENELDKIEEGELGWQRVLPGLLRALHQGARGGGPERHRRRGARPQAGGPGQGALSQVRRAGRAPHRPLRALLRLRELQADLRLREVAQEGARLPDRPTDEKCQLCGAPMVIKTGRFGEFLACTRYPECKGTRSIPLGHEVPQVHRGRPGRAAHQAGQVVLGLRALSGVRLLHLEPAGARDLPELRLGRDGEEGEQGRGRDPDLPQVPAQDRGAGAGGGGA